MSASSLPFLSFLAGAVALDQSPALCDDESEKWVSYGELRRRIQGLLPIWHGARRALVLCAAPRTVSGALAILSAAQAGQALLLVDPGSVRLLPFITAYEPEWIVWPTATKPGDQYDPVDWPLENLTLWRRAVPSEEPLHHELFLLLRPSGLEESSARTVRLSYDNISANVKASIQALTVLAHDRALLPLPLSYSSGLSVLFCLLAAGGGVLLTELDIKNRAFWEQAQKREITLFPGIPYHFDYIARAGLEHLHAPRIKTFWQMGGRMPNDRLQELLRQIVERKGSLYTLYGHTEAAPRLAVLPLHERPDKIGSSGQVLAGGTFTIEDGIVTYTGPNVMMGYAENRTDLAKGDVQNGRLSTRDLGYLDEEGFLHLTGK